MIVIHISGYGSITIINVEDGMVKRRSNYAFDNNSNNITTFIP